MKYCENCGAKLEDDAAFCDECGTACDNTQEAKAAKEDKTFEQPKSSETTGPVKSPIAGINPNIIVIGAIVIIVLVLLIILVSVLGKNKKAQNDNTPVSQEVSAETSVSEEIEQAGADISESVENGQTETTTESSGEPAVDENVTQTIQTDSVYSHKAISDIKLGNYVYSDEFYYVSIDIKDITDDFVTLWVYKENLVSQRVAEFEIKGRIMEDSNGYYSECPYYVSVHGTDSWLNELDATVYFSPNMQFVYYSADVVEGDYEFDASYGCLLIYENKNLPLEAAVDPQLPDGKYNIYYWSHTMQGGYFYTEADISETHGHSLNCPLNFYKLAISPDVQCFEWVDFTTTKVDINAFYGDMVNYESRMYSIGKWYEVDIEDGMIVRMMSVVA